MLEAGIVLLGIVLIAAGTAMMSVPAALIVTGVLLLAVEMWPAETRGKR